MSKYFKIFVALILASAFVFAFFQRSALANFVQNAWQGYKLTEGLVGYWSFDGKDIDLSQVTAEVIDRSGQGNNGDWRNHATTTAIGKIGQGINFFSNDADTNAFINIGDPGSGVLDFSAGDFAIGFWMKGNGYLNQGSSLNFSVGKQNHDAGPTAAGYSFTYGSTNLMAFNIGNGASAFSAPQIVSTAADKQWHYYTGVRSGTSAFLYVDGVSVNSTTVSGSVSNAISFIVGGDSGAQRNVNAIIDDVRVYNRTLSVDEIKRLYLMGASLKTNVTHRDELTEGLVANWTFDGKDIDLSQVTAEVRDRSGQGNNGDWRNHATTTVIGKIGQGINFDGVNDYVSGGDIADLDTATALTACAWVFHNTITADDAIIAKEDVPVSDGFLLFRDDVGFSSARTDIYTFVVWDSADVDTARIETPSTSAPLQTWTHVCGTYSANSTNGLRLYVNGVGVADNPVSTVGISAIAAGINPFVVGMRSDTTSMPHDGPIDDVRIYTRVLSADEIKRLYLMGASFKTNVTHRDELTEGLVGNWTFDGKDMYPNVRDSSGSGNHGSLLNQNPTTTTIGKIGQGLSFDGVNDYMISGVNGTTFTELTLSLWVNPSGNTATQKGIFQWSLALTDTTPFMLIARDTTNGLRLYADNTYIATGVVIPDMAWSHIVTTLNSTNLWTFYINGVSVATYQDDATHSFQARATSIYLGNGYNGYFAGGVDEARIYNRGLSADEVKRLYLMGK